MKSLVRFAFFFAVSGLAALAARAADGAQKHTEKAAPAAATAMADYPLDTCVVSGDKLGGDMGAPYDYIYKQPGQPDRLVRFCCKGCVKEFLKDPPKYLKVIDDAAAAKKAAKRG